MLQIEAANGHGQQGVESSLVLGNPEFVSRVPAVDGLCEPIWLRASGTLRAEYRAAVVVDRPAVDFRTLPEVALHRLPSAVVP